jgi:hypothetical protein
MFKLITETESIHVDNLKCLLFGDPGIGKTSLASTTKTPLLIDFDGGSQRACYKFKILTVEKWEDMIDFQKSKLMEELGIQTLICDGVGKMLDHYATEYVKQIPKNQQLGGELSLPGYGAIKNLFNHFLSWALTCKVNIIFIAHTTEEKEGSNVKFIPKITGGSYDILRESMDLIGFVESNSNKRIIDFAPKDRHIGKDCAQLGLIEIPDFKSPDYPLFMQEKIERTIQRMNSLSDNQTNILNKLFEFESQLKALTPEKCNAMIATVKAEPEKAIQLQMFDMLKQHAEKAGIKYEKTGQQFKNA